MTLMGNLRLRLLMPITALVFDVLIICLLLFFFPLISLFSQFAFILVL